MSLLAFNKKDVQKLDKGLDREYLIVNKLGAYSSSTIINCHTRKYHGLFVPKQAQLGIDNYVLLSYLDETIVVDDQELNLATHLYPESVNPRGYQWMEKFDLATIPTWEYQLPGGLKLQKQLLLVDDENQLLIKYRLLGKEGCRLKLEPFTAYRRIHDLSKERQLHEYTAASIENGMSYWMDGSYDRLYIQCNRSASYTNEGYWYFKNSYPVEQDRGYDFEEDLYRVGYLELDLQSGEDVIISVANREVEFKGLESKWEKELNKISEITTVNEALDRSAEQLLAVGERGVEVCAGYHWFGRWGRDTFIALPGLTLSRDKMNVCIDVIKVMLKDLEKGLLTNIGAAGEKQYNSIDASLWFFWTLIELEKAGHSKENIWKDFGAEMTSILSSYKEGTLYNIKMHPSGLIGGGEKGVALTWMDAKVDGEAVTPRRGYPVEINALWYNAICFSIDCAKAASDGEFVDDWKKLPPKIKKAFKKEFWVEKKSYLADVIDLEKGKKDMAMRPNQLLVVSLPYALLPEKAERSIVAQVDKKLFTKYGLRTLSPGSKNYFSRYFGDQETRDSSYHQGIIWPWLLGPYFDATLKADPKLALKRYDEVTTAMTKEIREKGVGSISELYHFDGGYEGVGTISQAWSVSELIRIEKRIEELRNKN